MARGGAAEISIGEVAASAAVSKALVHYHFHDKDSLLVALAHPPIAALIAPYTWSLPSPGATPR